MIFTETTRWGNVSDFDGSGYFADCTITLFFEAYGSGFCTSHLIEDWIVKKRHSNFLQWLPFMRYSTFKMFEAFEQKKILHNFSVNIRSMDCNRVVEVWGFRAIFRGNWNEVFLFSSHAFRLIYHCNSNIPFVPELECRLRKFNICWVYPSLSLSGQSKLHKYGVVYWYWWHFVIRNFFIESLTLWRGFLSVGGWVCEDSMWTRFVLTVVNIP